MILDVKSGEFSGFQILEHIDGLSVVHLIREIGICVSRVVCGILGRHGERRRGQKGKSQRPDHRSVLSLSAKTEMTMVMVFETKAEEPKENERDNRVKESDNGKNTRSINSHFHRVNGKHLEIGRMMSFVSAWTINLKSTLGYSVCLRSEILKQNGQISTPSVPEQ